MMKKLVYKIVSCFRIKKKAMPNSESVPKKDKKCIAGEFERCVICGAVTDEPISKPITLRKNYENGFGQMCADCAKMLQSSINKTEKHKSEKKQR